MKKITITKDCAVVKKTGRMLYHEDICYLVYSAAQIGFTYTGTKLFAELVTDELYQEKGFEGVVGVFVGEDTEPWKRFPLQKREGDYELFDRDEYAKAKKIPVEALPKELPVRIVKYSEAAFGAVGIKALFVEEDAEVAPLPEKKLKLEFIGDSITCGYGNEGVWGEDLFNTAQENPFKAYAVLTAEALDADYQLVSWSGIGLISKYVPPECDEPDESILAGENYLYTAMKFCERQGFPMERWDFASSVPEVVVINLGTNDDSYTRGIAEREAYFSEKYEELYQTVRGNYPDAKIVCCIGIMARGLNETIRAFVEKMNEWGDTQVYFVEFDGQREEDGIGTDWHPSLKTHEIAAKKLTEELRKILEPERV